MQNNQNDAPNKGENNKGQGNHGDNNIGNHNYGSRNKGNFNQGDDNFGDENTGSDNRGNRNIGASNVEDLNRGDNNIGAGNTDAFNNGDFNVGDFNNSRFAFGCFNTTAVGTRLGVTLESEWSILTFNHKSYMTIKSWRACEAYQLLLRIVPSPLKRNPNAKTTYKLEVLNSEDRAREATKHWLALSEGEREIIRAIPNFDAVILKEITGIDADV